MSFLCYSQRLRSDLFQRMIDHEKAEGNPKREKRMSELTAKDIYHNGEVEGTRPHPIKQPLDLDALAAIMGKRTPDNPADQEIRILICDNCGRWYPDDAASDSESCDDPKCGRFKQRMDWVVLHPNAVKVVCAAVNACEPLVARCRRVEGRLQFAENRLDELTRQRDELTRQANYWEGKYREIEASVKGGANGGT